MLMLNINNVNWKKLDNIYEEAFLDGVRFIRKIGDISLDIECNHCKSLIVTMEDVECMKKKNICEECYLVHYQPNSEKWNKGWRPS